jgi:hypothetical protein
MTCGGPSVRSLRGWGLPSTCANPRSRDVTETVYNRYAYDNEKRAALMQWEQRLTEIVS